MERRVTTPVGEHSTLPGWLLGTVRHGTMAASRLIQYQAGVRYNRAEARLFDLRHRTDTSGKTPMAGLDVDAHAAAHGTGFQSVNERHLRAVFGFLDLPPGHVLVDIGSGKGKVVLVASEYPFRRVVGVEISESLCSVAERNVAKWRARRRTVAPMEIAAVNALEYDFSDEDVIVLNNPFDSVFLHEFVSCIAKSLKSNPRPVWILYFNPSERGVIDESALFVEERTFTFFGPGRDVVVYRTVAA
jgi:precorrin-6B methylase 2